MILTFTHDLGILTSGWKRYPMHQTGSYLNIVLTHTENLSTSEQYKVTVACQELIQLSLRYLKFRIIGKYTSTIQDLRTMASQSGQDDWSREAPATAEEDKHASSQLATLWRSRCPIFKNYLRTSLEWYTIHIRKDHAVYTFDLKIAQARGLNIYQTGSFSIILYDTMPSEALVRVVKFYQWNSRQIFSFGTRSASLRCYTLVQFCWNRRPSAAIHGNSTERPVAWQQW